MYVYHCIYCDAYEHFELWPSHLKVVNSVYFLVHLVNSILKKSSTRQFPRHNKNGNGSDENDFNNGYIAELIYHFTARWRSDFIPCNYFSASIHYVIKLCHCEMIFIPCMLAVNFICCYKNLFCVVFKSVYSLKLDLCDKKQPTNKLKIRILSETSIPYLIRHASFILIVGSLHEKMAMPTGEHWWKKNSGAPWARTSNLWIPSLTRSPLSYLGIYVEWDLNFYCTVLYLATMLHLTAEPRGRPVASRMNEACTFIKTEIIAVNEFVELYVHIYNYALNDIFNIKLLCMHDAMTCNIMATCMYTIALYSKSLNPTPHISWGSSVGSALDLNSKGCWFEPTVCYYFSTMFACWHSHLYRWRPTIRMNEAWRIK